MRAKIIHIGNSRGIRLPKPLIEQAGLGEEVDLEVREGAIVITPRENPRGDWAEAARALAARGEDVLLDEPAPTDFDLEEWDW